MKITLEKNEVEEILDIVKTFNPKKIDIEQDCSSGIGCSLKVSFDLMVHDTMGKFTIDLTNVEDW